MNAADLARLELAKRAYRASEPSATEVQRGVRRARIGLRRPKSHKRWFSKGLVMVVLAVGGLAYAKPQALGDLVMSALVTSKPAGNRGSGRALGAAEPAAAEPAKAIGKAAPSAANAAPSSELAPPSTEAAFVAPATKKSVPAPRAAVATTPAAARPATAASNAENSTRKSLAQASAVSDWGRVGQALAQGDEQQALAALSELSASDDQRTRDKADLGRAQLFMANGNRDSACSLARSLTNRRAGSRIERQAQVLLKSCSR